MTKQTENPDWETLLAHAALLQTKIPAAILVGGTAAALHAGHRISFDHDHVIKDMARNYDAAILALENARLPVVPGLSGPDLVMLDRSASPASR